MIGTAILTGVALLSLWGNFEQYCENKTERENRTTCF